MDLRSLEYNWNLLGESDPLWAVLMNPDRRGNRWDPQEFFLTGYHDIVYAMHQIAWQGLSVERGERSTSAAPSVDCRKAWPATLTRWTAWTSRRP